VTPTDNLNQPELASGAGANHPGTDISGVVYHNPDHHQDIVVTPIKSQRSTVPFTIIPLWRVGADIKSDKPGTSSTRAIECYMTPSQDATLPRLADAITIIDDHHGDAAKRTDVKHQQCTPASDITVIPILLLRYRSLQVPQTSSSTMDNTTSPSPGRANSSAQIRKNDLEMGIREVKDVGETRGTHLQVNHLGETLSRPPADIQDRGTYHPISELRLQSIRRATQNSQLEAGLHHHSSSTVT
jgi:hypothetical protein